MSVHESLALWVEEQLALRSMPTAALTPITGDAGFREYFRLATQPALLAVYGPPQIEKHAAFVQISEHWRAHSVPAPEVVAYDVDRGFLLIEDFGATSLSAVLDACETNLAQVADCYRAVLTQLNRLQTLPSESWYPHYDIAALQTELDLFIPWFVERLLNYELSNDDKLMLQTLFDRLIENVSAQPQVIVHRDFHCRNIHVKGGQLKHLGFIDFQDALVGPVTYDVVSLLKDCYRCWPTAFVQEQALSYRKTLPLNLQMDGETDFLQAMDATGLQRHLKVLGIFARLHLRDGKAQYLNDLPLVVEYVRQAFSRYEYCQPAGQWFEERLMPVIKQQPWYRSVGIQP